MFSVLGFNKTVGEWLPERQGSEHERDNCKNDNGIARVRPSNVSNLRNAYQDLYLGILIASGGCVNVCGVTIMSDYFWCHGRVSYKVTTDRVKGTKGSKVLRTRKIKQHHNEYYDVNRGIIFVVKAVRTILECIWKSDQTIAPRHEPLKQDRGPKKRNTRVGACNIVQYNK